MKPNAHRQVGHAAIAHAPDGRASARAAPSRRRLPSSRQATFHRTGR